MISMNQLLVLLFLMILTFISCYAVIFQTYEYRKSFAILEDLKLEKEDLSFQSNILLEEVKYFKNHISLRKFASESLGMIVPNSKNSIYIKKEKNK